MSAKHREVPEQVPVRARVGVDDRWGRAACRASAGPTNAARPQMHADHRDAEDDVAPRRVGPEGHAVLLQALLVLRRGTSSGRPARRASGGSEMPWRRTSKRCRPTKAKMQRRDEEDVDGEEAAQRRAADGVAAEDEARERARRRRARAPPARRRRRPTRSAFWSQRRSCPVNPMPSVKSEEQHAREPVHLARELVGADEEHLRHVHADHEHHRRGAVVVQPAQEAAEGRVVGDEEQRVVRLRRTTAMYENASVTPLSTWMMNANERRAAEDVPPARVRAGRGAS